MSKFIRLFIILLLITLSISLYSQPKATVQFFGGYTAPLGDYKGTFGDSTITPYTSDSLTYLMQSGINYGVSFKKPVTKKSNIYITASLAFNSIGQNKSFKTLTVKLRQSIFSFAMGAEFQVAPVKSKINPFAGAELTANIFNGSLTQSNSTTTLTLNMRGAFRLGFMVGGGVDFAFHQNVGLIVGVKYAYTNVIGKKYEADTENDYGLNDAEYTINGAVYPSRKIQFLEFYGGVSFYFGK